MSGPEDVLPLLTNGDTGPEKPYYAVFDFSALNCFMCVEACVRKWNGRMLKGH